MTTPQTQSPPPLPPTMPVLTWRDIERYEYDGELGAHTLHRWTFEATRSAPDSWGRVHCALHRACGGRYPGEFSNDPKQSLDDMAAAWNAMPPLLGYVLSPDKSHFILPTPTTGEEKQR